jgi:hypothetical protein
MYFGLRWFFPYLSIDHLTLFQALISSGKIVIKNNEDNQISLSKIDKRIAWSIFTQYWNTTTNEPVIEKGDVMIN